MANLLFLTEEISEEHKTFVSQLLVILLYCIPDIFYT